MLSYRLDGILTGGPRTTRPMPIRLEPAARRHTRRRFFAHLVSALGAMSVARTVLGAAPESMKPADETELAASFEFVIDTLVPADTDPGAVAAGVAATLYTQIAANAQHRARLAAMLAWIDRAALAKYRSRFRELPLAERTEALLERLAAHDADGADARAELGYLRTRTLALFYTSPAGYRMLDYHPPSAGGYPDYADPL